MDTVKELYENTEQFIDKEISLGGWVRTIRNSKNISFIQLNDGSCFKNIQIVFDNKLENYNDVSKLCVGSSITVNGVAVKSIGKEQSLEIKANIIQIENRAPENYPLQKKHHTLEYLRTVAHLRPRTNTFSAVFKIRSLAAFAIHKFFNENNFVYLNSPIITTSDCEGAGEMFRVTTLKKDLTQSQEDFFGKAAYLTVSGQLSAEAFASAFRNIYTFGPTFRAENSNTPRHAAEFWMIEPEMAFADLSDCMRMAENMLKSAIRYVMDNAKDELEFCNNFIDKNLLDRLTHIMNSDFEVLTYTDAIKLLMDSGKNFEYKIFWGADLQTEHERYITEEIFKKPVFVTNYPKDIKAFYMRQNDDKKTVAAVDLLVPGVGEIIGGSQREERLELLIDRMKELNLNLDDYWWYLDLRRFGSVKHSGYGLGFERFIMYLTGISNIRDVIPFPRTVNNAEF